MVRISEIRRYRHKLEALGFGVTYRKRRKMKVYLCARQN